MGRSYTKKQAQGKIYKLSEIIYELICEKAARLQLKLHMKKQDCQVGWLVYDAANVLMLAYFTCSSKYNTMSRCATVVMNTYHHQERCIFNTIYAIVSILGICAWGDRTQRSKTESVQVVRNHL